MRMQDKSGEGEADAFSEMQTEEEKQPEPDQGGPGTPTRRGHTPSGEQRAAARGVSADQ